MGWDIHRLDLLTKKNPKFSWRQLVWVLLSKLWLYEWSPTECVDNNSDDVGYHGGDGVLGAVCPCPDLQRGDGHLLVTVPPGAEAGRAGGPGAGL